jgi:DNA-binding transcriptional ArsR family regulator
MQTGPSLSAVAGLIGEPARAAMLSALMGGQALPAGDLAQQAYVTPQTASAHLSKLVAGGLLEVKKVGRQRYYSLKNADVAHALEALLSIARPAPVRSQRGSPQYQALCSARTCYDHLAGRLGIAVTQAMLHKALIDPDGPSYRLTAAGTSWLAEQRIDEQALRKGRRKFARACLDWTERQDHLGGALGAAVAGWFFENRWVQRIPNTRALLLTQAGRDGMLRALGVRLEG